MMVTMPTWLLALSYAVCISVGYAASWYGVVHIGNALLHRHHREANTMPNRRTPWVPIIILVAAAMVITLGVMYGLDARHRSEQAAKQRADDKAAAARYAAEQAAYDACITQWGDDLVATINSSRGARAAYDAAAQWRADATADVLAAALGLASTPPTTTSADVVTALRAAQRADAKVHAAAHDLRETQNTNTYEPPTLACADERTDP